MTAIVAVVEDGIVYMGGDSAACNPELPHRYAAKTPKVFVKNIPGSIGYIIGYTHSYRAGQIVSNLVDLPAPPNGVDAEFMVTKFAETIRLACKIYELPDEDYGTFLVGVDAQIFTICPDFSVLEPQYPYMAIGAGDAYALGALRASENLGMPAIKRVELALGTAAEFNGMVMPPFNYVRTEYDR